MGPKMLALAATATDGTLLNWSSPGEVERAADAAADQPQHVVLAHALASERAAEVLAALRERVDVAEHVEVVVGPVVGTHTGPGAVGIALAPSALTSASTGGEPPVGQPTG